ncbi:MAG: ATP-binding cassette domain-containing protein [bacterium]|nr:ATP-binding cassette domain-containing protein [bacterium]
MIRIENLSKSYNSQLAVDNISFEVKTGEVLGFLGPNGAGKTTTMKIITCFMPPTSGDVFVDDLDIYEHSLEIRRKIGYLPEHTALYQDMNVIDYLAYVAELREIPARKQRGRIREMVDLCGLSEVRSKNIGELSKGFRQRVGLAQAMIHAPDILVLDEPTIGLDPNQIVEIRGLIKQLGQEKTVILSTHILSEVQTVCNRVIIINKGQLVADGTPTELTGNLKGEETIYFELKGVSPDFKPALENLAGVAEIIEETPLEGSTVYRIESKKEDIREELFHLAGHQGWTILELRREQTSLEDVFRELTK